MTRGRDRRAALLVVVLFAVSVDAVAGCAPPPPLPVVIVYGDSLGVESAPALREHLAAVAPGHQLVTRVAGGSAVCDWHARMREDTSLRPELVVLAFTGNRFTDCSRRSSTWDRYRADTWWSIGFWQGRRVPTLVVAPPGPVGSDPAEREAALAALDAARGTGSASVDLAPWFTSPHDGRFGERLPCLPGEGPAQGCEADGIQVRAGHTSRGDDGVHLCGDACGRYSSGVHRFAYVVAAAIGERLGLPPRPTLPRPGP
jgi:hypothetical protein